MKRIIALAGSNSKNSINKQLAESVANKIEEIEVTVLDLNNYKLPIYGVDEETNNGIPKDAIKLNEELLKANGFVISLAEHNGSYSVAFKNAFDWLSRIDQKVWKNKPMLLMATSPGERGGSTVLQSASTTFPYLGANIVAEFSLPSFNNNFSEGIINNYELRTEIDEKIRVFEKSI